MPTWCGDAAAMQYEINCACFTGRKQMKTDEEFTASLEIKSSRIGEPPLVRNLPTRVAEKPRYRWSFSSWVPFNGAYNWTRGAEAIARQYSVRAIRVISTSHRHPPLLSTLARVSSECWSTYGIVIPLPERVD